MTIPDHYVTRAARALLDAQGCTTPLAEMHPEDAGYALTDARAAIEAVAADIWDEGHEAGFRLGSAIYDTWDEDETPNPYRASEDA